MGLLDKFNAVEIKADNRISEADLAYCTTIQAAYDKSIKRLNPIHTLLLKFTDEQMDIMGAKAGQMPRFLEGCSSAISSVYDDITHRHSKFVNSLISYFESEYNVKLDRTPIIEHLIPQKPDSNRWDESYKQDCADYYKEIEELSLSYTSVIDEIYAQLDGFSFEERAINELKEKCWNAIHPSRYYHSDPKEEFEVKGNTLQLSYGCTYSDWSSYWELTDSTKTVLDGIAHYFYGMFKYGASMFYDLRKEWRIERNTFEYTGFVSKVKLFKNGRVDIKFADSKCLNEFVEQYLRTRIGGNDND